MHLFQMLSKFIYMAPLIHDFHINHHREGTRILRGDRVELGIPCNCKKDVIYIKQERATYKISCS